MGILLVANVLLLTKTGVQTEYLHTIFIAGLYYLIGRNIQESDLPFLFISLYIITIWFLCVGLWQLTTGILHAAQWKSIPLLVKGTFSNSGVFGIVLSVHFSILYYLKRHFWLFHKIMLIILPALIIVTLSRTAMICVATVIITTERERLLKIFQRIAIYIKGLIIVLSLTIIAGFYIFKSSSASGRLLIWKTAILNIDTALPLGIGLDQFPIRYPDWQAHYFASANRTTGEKLLAGNTFFAFNEFLQLFIELGIPGVIICCILTVRLLRNKTDQSFRIIIMVILVACMFSYPLHIPYILIIFLLTAGIIASGENAIINIHCSYPIVIWLLIFSGGSLFLIHQHKQYKVLSSWLLAHEHIRSSESEALSIYASLGRDLNKKGSFLYNYGAELYETRHYELSVQQLEAAKSYFNHIDLHLYLGKAYEATGRLPQAECSFLNASNMIPHRFYPKYFLYQVYIKQKKFGKAQETAQEIINMPIKVESQVIKNIKEEMHYYLNEKRQ